MGKIIKSKTTTVDLEGALEGGTVTWRRSISVALMRKMLDASAAIDADAPDDAPVTEEDTKKSLESVAVIIETLAPRLVSWDLLNEDESPIPPTRQTLEEMDMEYLFELFTSFMGVVGELPNALKPVSSNSPTPAADADSPGV